MRFKSFRGYLATFLSIALLIIAFFYNEINRIVLLFFSVLFLINAIKELLEDNETRKNNKQ